MVSGSRLAWGVWVSALLGTFVTAQGCISNGDASLGNDGTTAGSGGVGNDGKAGSNATTSGGKSGAGGASLASGGKSVVPSTGEGGATLVTGGESGETGEGGHQAVGSCELPIEVGPCDAAIPRFAFDAASGECKPFTYGGCEGNANNFETLADCQSSCESLVCPAHLQSDTVYKVYPLNRPERACVTLNEPIVVSCSMLLDPSLTVPSDYGQSFCVKRDDQLYRAGTTLPKADGWADCSAIEAELVDEAPDCNDL